MSELTMEELAKAVAKGERDAAEAVARLDKMVVYPRFLGMDDAGLPVWELANGRWTWGDDPYKAARMQRTFQPERYVDKYGVPTQIDAA